MMKVLLTVIFMSSAFLSIKAQSLSLGPVLGSNYSSISEANNGERLLGLSAGIFANYSINEKIGLNLKALYSQMGVASSISDDNLRLIYFQIPLTGVYYFGQIGDKFRPKVFLGPYVGFLLNAKNGDIDIKDSFNSIDFGGLLGLGFNYSLNNSRWLNVDLGYSTAFTDVYSANNVNGQNNALFLNVGLSFPIGG